MFCWTKNSLRTSLKRKLGFSSTCALCVLDYRFRRVSVLTNSKMEFGQIPRDHWYQPTWIDEEKAKEGRKQMEDDNIIYGGGLTLIVSCKRELTCSRFRVVGIFSIAMRLSSLGFRYRNMCRFNSGVRSPLSDVESVLLIDYYSFSSDMNCYRNTDGIGE